MSTSFSANQYQNAFYSKKLQNWEVQRVFREHPRTLTGFTKVIIANDRGHLLDGIPRSRKNPWGDFVGTWDLPIKIPGNCARVATARGAHSQDLLKERAEEAQWVMHGGLKNSKRQNLDHAYASKVPPRQEGADPSPGPGTPDRKMSAERRSGAEAPASSMFPAINGAKPPSPALRSPPPQQIFTPVGSNKIPTPGLGTPQPNLGRSPSPPVKSPVIARSPGELVAL